MTKIRCGEVAWKAEKAVVKFTVEQGVYMNYEDAVEVRQLVIDTAVSYHKPVYLLVDMRGIKGASKEGRKYFSSHPNPVAKACAVIVGSGFSRLLGNFLIGLNRPAFPLKLFTNESAALGWLEGLQGKRNCN